MSSELKTIVAVQDATSAEFYESLLEENGIPAYVPSLFTIALQNPEFWVTLGTVGVQVPAEYEERARRILHDLESQDEDEPARAAQPLDMPAVIPENQCKRWFLTVFIITSTVFGLIGVVTVQHDWWSAGQLIFIIPFTFIAIVGLIRLCGFVEQQIARRKQFSEELQQAESEPIEWSDSEAVEEEPHDVSGLHLLLKLLVLAIAAIVALHVYNFLLTL